jgi:hypothetical protein
LAIIAARNEHEAKTGILIKDFETKIVEFFSYVRESTEGDRLIVKNNSQFLRMKSMTTLRRFIVDTKRLIDRQLATIFSRKLKT